MTRKTNILLIDDNLTVRQALGQVLAVENYHVVATDNQHDALRAFGQRPIDIVLLDLSPRNEDVWDTLQRLTALRPDLPIVAMTARREYLEPYSGAHWVDVLLDKPLNLPVLIHTLQQLASPTAYTRRSRQPDPNAALWKNNPYL